MKKLVSATMAFLMLLSLTACGGGTETPTQAPVSVTSTVTGDTVQIKVSNIQIDPDVKADSIKIKFEKAYSGADSVITIKNEKDEIISSVTVSEGMSEVEFDTTNVNLLGISTLRISAPSDIVIKDVAVMAAEAPVTTTEATTTEVTTTTEATTTAEITTTTAVTTEEMVGTEYPISRSDYNFVAEHCTERYMPIESLSEWSIYELRNFFKKGPEVAWEEEKVEPYKVYSRGNRLIRLFPYSGAYVNPCYATHFCEELEVIAITTTGYAKIDEFQYIYMEFISETVPTEVQEMTDELFLY